nr:ribonuclease H-like domain-containing protein [Tanacetum cinerariifolium]
MVALKYKEEHNKVGYLLKPTGSDDYHQIIDFLSESHIRYAFTSNPIIFDSLVKQFWSTATLKESELGPPAILATIDKTPYTITEALVRSRLQLADDGGVVDLPILKIYSRMDNLGYHKSESWDQFGSPIAIALICLSDGRHFNWSKYSFRGMVNYIENVKKFLMYPRFLQTILGEGAEVAAQDVPHLVPAPDQSPSHLPTPFRPQSPDPVAPVLEHDHSSAQPETAAGSFLLRKLFKDIVGKLVKKVKSLEVKLKTKKRKLVVSDSDPEDNTTQDMDLDALHALANAAVAADSDIPSRNTSQVPAASPCAPTVVPSATSEVPPAPFAIPTGASGVAPDASDVSPGPSVTPTAALPIPADSLKVLAAVPFDSPNVPSGASSKGKSPMVEEDIPVTARSLGRGKRIDWVRKLLKGYMRKKWLNWKEKEQRNKERDNKMSLNLPKFEKIHKVQSQSQIQAFRQTLKRPGHVLEEPPTKRPKSSEAYTPSMPEVSVSLAVTSPPSFRTRRKSLGRKHMHKSKSTPPTLDLDAPAQTFLKVVVDEHSDDEDYVDEVWSAVVGWELLSTPLGEINALYRIDGSTKHFTTLRQILHLVDRQDLMKLYGLVVQYYEHHPTVGAGLLFWGDLQVLFDSQSRGKELASPEQTTTGKDISNSFMAVMICQKSLAYSNSPMIRVLRVGLVINPPRYEVPTGRVIVPTGRYIVPTGSVIVANGRAIWRTLLKKTTFLHTRLTLFSMDSLNTPVVSAAKLPILNPNEFDLWKMRIEQYFFMTDYSLWEVILHGDSRVVQQVSHSQSTSSQLDNEDLKQIDVDDLEEMDLRWQMAILTMRARMFLQRTGRNLDDNRATSMGFDMSKVECYNYHRKGHFARECRSPKDSRSYQAEEVHANFDLMSITSSSSSSDNELSPTKTAQDLSHTNETSAPIIEDWVSDSEDEYETNDPQIVPSFVQSSKQVTTPRTSIQPTEAPFLDATLKPTSPKSNRSGKRKNRKTYFVCRSVDHLIKDYDYHAKKKTQPTPRNYAHRGNNKQNASFTHKHTPLHMVHAVMLTQSKPVSITAARPFCVVVPKIMVTRPRHAHSIDTKSKSLIRRHITRSPSPKTSISPPRVTVAQAPVVSAAKGKKGKWVWRPKCPTLDHDFRTTSASITLKQFNYNDALGRSNGCSRHMTGNMSYLSNFEELNGGYVAFGGNPKGGKIFGKGKIKTGAA